MGCRSMILLMVLAVGVALADGPSPAMPLGALLPRCASMEFMRLPRRPSMRGFERRLVKLFWTVFHSSPLAKRLIAHYIDSGPDLTLSLSDILDVGAELRIDNGRPGDSRQNPFVAELRKARARRAAFVKLRIAVPKTAATAGTLGRFMATYEGILKITQDGSWTFRGAMSYSDVFDFDNTSIRNVIFNRGRGWSGELQTLIANRYMPGRAYRISSKKMPFVQSYDAQTRKHSWTGQDFALRERHEDPLLILLRQFRIAFCSESL